MWRYYNSLYYLPLVDYFSIYSYPVFVEICNQIADHVKKPLKGQDESPSFRLAANEGFYYLNRVIYENNLEQKNQSRPFWKSP